MSSTNARRRSRNNRAFALCALLLAGGSGCGGDPDDGGREVRLGVTAATAPPPTATGAENAATAARRPAAAAAPKPAIEQWPIPFPQKRLDETDAYSRRHYGRATHRLRPRTIVQHYTAVEPAQAVHDLFANDVPDVELRELPQVCSHFLVDTDGTIFQLVPATTICRHTVGLNDVAIGIEHIGRSDSDVLRNERQLAASLSLTAWLRCRHGIPVADVIGHNESLSSRYHHENVAGLRNQTHPDFSRASMDTYRPRLTRRQC
jgi:beta-N-acetylhexosaminidase